MDWISIEVPAGVDPATAKRHAERAVRALATIQQIETALAAVDELPGPGRMAQAALRAQRRDEIGRVREMLLDSGDGTVAPAWTEVKALLGETGWSEADLIAWAAAPNAWLEGGTPAEEVLAHPEAVTVRLRHAVDAARSI
ncbi:hypothetical protein [Microbacterium sp.]|uniref:hypothetical protein n=1 Tax=Microbacterium sp. TaxID=51671 RepID=UPI002736017C|nr:hypothetical protein [Microbacterium sp.]MDP3953189.1 hypothetical protein [Microbacterium sp.]